MTTLVDRGVGEPLVGGRTRLRQLPLDEMSLIWRALPPSDPVSHPQCGYVPTGMACHACGGRLGEALGPPFVYQMDVLEDDHLTVDIAGGEQAGKSFVTAMKGYRILLGFLGEYGPSGRAAGEVAWIVANSYELTRVEFQNLRDFFRMSQLKSSSSKRVDPGEINIKVPGGYFTIKTRSADDASTLRAESPVVVLIGEDALLSWDAFERITSRVARAQATFPGYGAIIGSGTFEGSLGWKPTQWKKWQGTAEQERGNVRSMSLPSHSNVFVYPGGLDHSVLIEQKAKLPKSVWEERFLAIPSPPSGRVHQSFDSTIHVQDAAYDPDEPLLLGIDPGYSGRSSTYAVEVVQRRYTGCRNNHYWVVDEIFEKQLTVDMITGMAMSRHWWGNSDKKGVIDIAGAAHAGAQESNEEVWMKKTGLILRHQRVNIRPGIDRMESMLQTCPLCHEPYLVFDPSCVGVLSELGHTQNPFDDQVHVYSWQTDREGNVVGTTPRDEYCDGVKALTYLFVDELGYATTSGSRRRVRVRRQRR